MKKYIIPVIAILLFVASCDWFQKNDKLTDLKTEYSINPIGLDVINPRFSWKLNDTTRNTFQQDYTILVASEPSKLKPGKADVWESGKIESDESVFIPYEGPELQSATRYFWTVEVTTNKGDKFKAESPAFFETGFLSPDDWKADWISFDPEEYRDKLPPFTAERPRSLIFRNEFEIPEGIESARAYVSGLGNYVLFLNGERVGKDLLTPGWTDYNVRLQYQVYDVTSLLKKGENAAGMLMGNLWWSSGLGWRGGVAYSKGPLKALLQLEITLKNGEKKVVSTNEEWKAQLSPIAENTIYHGETYDSRLEIPMWSEPGLNTDSWLPVKKTSLGDLSLSAQKAPPIQITDTLVPVSVSEVQPGVFVYDMGINMVGIARISGINGKNGDTITLRFAELLHKDGTVAQENLRSAEATDRYILNGSGNESWQPHFTYHGFRYVQMEGFEGKPDASNLTGLRFYSSAEEKGRFASSNDLLNQIWKNILNGQKGNMHSVPTDCPQRDERLGWMGDAQIFAPTSCYNMGMNAFYYKWMRDITDSQHESGYVYDVNPAIVVGGPAKAGWGDAVTVVPWVVYNFYGDTRILSDYYEGMKEWVEFMKRKSEDHIYRWSETEGDWEGYGDWISVVKSPTAPISAAYYYHSTGLLAKAAGVLGYTGDQKYYSSLADSIAEAFHKRFFLKDSLNYPWGTQTANLIPLNFSLTPDSLKPVTAGNIIKDVKDRGFHPTTGFLGTNLLLPTLSNYGEHESAYKTAINTEYPSWGYMVKKGASSMWELWNSDTERPEGMNSRNHFALGSVGEWYFSHLAGISAMEPGFKKIKIRPMPAEGLDWVTVDYETPYGMLRAYWSKDKGSLHLDVTIPTNSSAEVHIPISGFQNPEVLEIDRVLLSNGEFTSAESIEMVSLDAGYLTLDIPSGSYGFTVKEQ